VTHDAEPAPAAGPLDAHPGSARSDTAPADTAAPRRCRNCGAPAPGAYCASCGQETRARVPTLREFTREAAGRYVAVDGTLWRTLFALLFRPGFLTREYFAGRRRRFVRPFRLYVAASLTCFVAIGFGVNTAQVTEVASAPAPARSGATAPRFDPAAGKAGSLSPGSEVPGLTIRIDDVLTDLPAAMKPLESMLRQRIGRFKALPPDERMDRFVSGARRHAPYAMFVLVPAFALLLKLAYPRRARRPLRPALYGEHLVFAVHNHAFLFGVATFTKFLPKPFAALAWAWAAAYLVLSLRAVYGDSWTGAVTRALGLFVAYVPLVFIVATVVVVAAVVIG
jgi:hypothetical protein